MKALLEKPPRLTAASRYTVLNGAIYLGVGTLLIVWPRMTQTLFMEPVFVGREEVLMRARSNGRSDRLALLVWRSSGSRQFVAASIIDRLVFVPIVLLPLLAIGAWVFLARK